jgi:hypothetical protein
VSSSSSKGSTAESDGSGGQFNSDPRDAEKREIPGRKTLALASSSRGSITGRYGLKPPSEPSISEPARVTSEDNVSTAESIKRLEGPLSQKLTLNLPINDLNAASATSRVQCAFVEDQLAALEAMVASGEQQLEEIQPVFEAIANRTQNLTRTANVVSAKLDALEERMNEEGLRSYSLSVELVRFFISFFSFLATLLVLVWNRLGRNRQL